MILILTQAIYEYIHIYIFGQSKHESGGIDCKVKCVCILGGDEIAGVVDGDD